MSLVERRDAFLAEGLAGSSNRRVDEADGMIGVGGLETGCCQEGGIVKGMDSVGTGVYLLTEGEPDIYTRKLAKPVIEFNQHGSRYNERFGEAFQEFATNLVVWIALIEGGKQNTGVDYERHGVPATSSKRSPVSRADGPLWLAKRPKVGFGRA